MINSKKITSKVLIGIFLLTFFTFKLTPYIKINSSESGFESSEAIRESGDAIKNYIIEGAGFFLSSHSEFLQFLNKIELLDENGIDYTELQTLLTQTIDDLEKANETYTLLNETVTQTPYRQEVILRLLAFDYYTFQKTNNLNATIFNEAAAYLKTGDIRGVFSRVGKNTAAILKGLNKVKKMTDAELFPEISLLWRLNQDYAEALLFGQYVAEIFTTIKNDMKD